MSNELKPCPFCGSDATLEYNENCGWQVYCDDRRCTVETSTYFRGTLEEAIEAWNTRHPITADDKMRAGMNIIYEMIMRGER